MIFFKKVINLTRDNWYGLHLLTNSSNLPVPDNPHRQLFDRELFFPGFHIYINGQIAFKWSMRMASTALEKVRSEALNLPEAERAELAYNLVVSLDEPPDSDVEKAWDMEIMRRLSEIDSGTANLVDRKEFRRRMRLRINGS